MFLKEFKSTDLQRATKEVFEVAVKEPVIINRMGHDSVIMLSKKMYAELVKKAEK